MGLYVSTKLYIYGSAQDLPISDLNRSASKLFTSQLLLSLQLSLSTLINEEIQPGLRVPAYICHVRLGFLGVNIGVVQ